MVRQDDLILEGVHASEIASLRALADGAVPPARRDIVPLHAKGWVDVIGDDAIITLTGRALLEGKSVRLR
ncbi:hypothetical protein NIM87_14060 [Devosia sp. XJ19-1]|uniref:Uncharacterized protein n=1 Tax=Devosia ureilytica TaxID=2952754 RepID=A0A9Q4AQ25_9HYPH|nr:hypothetical protein [Devosia ureilytica]MCP8884638.1 hypothetical protein [Devosia ureilytica]MCP8888268.1 hypothetical protein [Devosia ureilytica]